MTDEELERAHPKPRWSWWVPLACVLLVVISVVSVLTFLRANTGAATSADIKASQAQDRITRERADCRSEYNARISEVKDQRLKFISDVVVASVAGDHALVGTISKQLDMLNTKIALLPRLDVAVNEGFTLDGIHYRKCPG